MAPINVSYRVLSPQSGHSPSHPVAVISGAEGEARKPQGGFRRKQTFTALIRNDWVWVEDRRLPTMTRKIFCYKRCYKLGISLKNKYMILFNLFIEGQYPSVSATGA
ncbi:hypothetical protein [Erythrobacter sp. WG]|uniref:hypothetical protein n=1 Tax=Erythrobacter sp. WG TaxID=2985510 RepID=UPI00226E8BB4|nr:hypothetical protein [Erythrobacter sp. WG]MCX9147450.1 hypothetical protein [Erythrobacter sp. WG]